jgi:hypothetical protein
MAKTTWDVWVVLANDPSQTIAYLPRWRTFTLSDQLNDVGSATVEHDFADPFFAAFQEERGDSLLEGPYALQIRRNGTPVFTFFIEDVQVDRAGVSQELIMGGRGIASALEWGIVLPEDFSNQVRATAGTTQRPKFFDRLFPGYSYNVRVATTGNLSASYSNGPQTDVPGAGARLTATSNGSINNSGIDGVDDLVVGDTVLVKDQTTSAHNGVYWIVSIGGASDPWVLQRTARADGSPIGDLAVDNAAFVNEGTTNGYTSWRISDNGSLSSSSQVGTNNIVWSSVSLGSFTGISAFYILFKEADTGYEYSTKKTDFGTVKTLYGRGGVGYAVDWPLSLDSTLTSSLGKTDSKGHVVQDGGNFNIAVGRTLLDVLNEVSSNTGVDWHVSATGVISIAVRPFSNATVVFDEPFGDDLTSASAALLFSLPMLDEVETRTSVAELRTVVYGSDGFNLDRQISERTGTYGFREMFIENTSDDAPAVANITAAAVRQVKDGKLQITASFAERDGMIAWENFNIGDKVLVEIDTGTFSERIISAIGASVDDSGNETVEVTFGDVFQDIASNLKYAANYGRLGAAEIPTYTLRGTSSKPSAPKGTSVGAEVQGLSNRVVVSWSAPDNTSAAQYEAVVYREEQDNVGIAITYPITDIYRDGNIAYCEVSSSTGFVVGDWINIYDTDDGYFDRTNVFLTSASGALFTFDDAGPDIPSGTYSSGDVVRVVERHSTTVPSSQTSAGFENLGAPGREYQFTVTPYTVNGQSGLPSPPFTFTASASAQVVLDGAIRSNNYVQDTSGWTIEADGNAELNQVTIRNGAWVQGTLTAPTLQTSTSNPKLVITSAGLYAYNSTGDIVTSIDSTTGVFSTVSGSFSGTIDVGGNDATSFHVDTNGNIWSGAATYAAAPFRVSNLGDMLATSGTIGGFEIIGDNLVSGGGYTGSIALGPNASWEPGAASLRIEGVNGKTTVFGAAVAFEHISNGGYIQINATTQIIGVRNNSTGTTIYPDRVESDLFHGNLNGNANTATSAGSADSANYATAAGYAASAGDADTVDGYNANDDWTDNGSIPIRGGGDASVGAKYFRFWGTDGVALGNSDDIRVRYDGYILRYYSKRELKEQILEIDPSFAISTIKSLQPVSFRWKDDSSSNQLYAEIADTYKEYGFIAEDVAGTNPHLASYSLNEDETTISPSSWQSHGMISVSVAAIKGLIAKIEALESRVQALESQP